MAKVVKKLKITEKDSNILGAILKAGEKEAAGDPSVDKDNWRSYVDILDEGHFETKMAKAVFAAVADIRHAGETLDINNLIDHLQRTGCYDKTAAYTEDPNSLTGPDLRMLYRTFSTLQMITDEVGRQEMDRKRKQSAELADTIKRSILTGEDDLFWKSLRMLKDLQGSASKNDVTFNERVDRFFQKALEIQAAGGIRFKTGYDELDEKIIGYMGSDIITVFGHPAQGKTLTAMNLIVRAINSGARIMLITIEDSGDRMAGRYAAIKLGISMYGLYSGKISQRDLSIISSGISSVYTDNLHIIDTAYTLPDIYRHVLSFKPDILFVDHIHIMQLPKADSKEQSVSALMTGFKHMSKEEDLPVVLLAQTRKAATRTTHPSIDDLYYSKDIENISSVAMSVCWPWKVDNALNEFDYSWLIQKARIGTTGQIDLTIDKQSLGIYEKNNVPSFLASRIAGLSSGGFGGPTI